MEGMLVFHVLLLCILVLVADGQTHGGCLQFNGRGKVEFSDNINIRSSAHFMLNMKTKSESGVLYYAEGKRNQVYDFEGVFLRDGYLHYFLFNPGVYGTGDTFGFYGNSSQKVNNGYWTTVEFFRNREVEIIDENQEKRIEYQTGLTVNRTQSNVDSRWRHDVMIYQPIILGQDPHLTERREQSIGGFKGRIKDFQEVSHNHYFTKERLAEGVWHCIDVPDAPDAV